MQENTVANYLPVNLIFLISESKGKKARQKSTRDKHADHPNLADFPIPQELHPGNVVRPDSAMQSNLDGFTRCLRGIHHGPAFMNGMASGLLHEDMGTSLDGCDGLQGMPVIRSSDHYRVNVVAGTQVTVIKIGLAVLVAVFLVHGLLASFRSTPAVTICVVLVTVRNRDTLNILVIDMGLHHAKASVTDADEAHDHPLAGGGIPIFAEGARWNDGRKTDGGAGGS